MKCLRVMSYTFAIIHEFKNFILMFENKRFAEASAKLKIAKVCLYQPR